MGHISCVCAWGLVLGIYHDSMWIQGSNECFKKSSPQSKIYSRLKKIHNMILPQIYDSMTLSNLVKVSCNFTCSLDYIRLLHMHIFLVFNFFCVRTPNHTSFKYRYPIKISNQTWLAFYCSKMWGLTLIVPKYSMTLGAYKNVWCL